MQLELQHPMNIYGLYIVETKKYTSNKYYQFCCIRVSVGSAVSKQNIQTAATKF